MDLPPNRLKQELTLGAALLWMWVVIPWHGIVEVIGNCGVDGVIIDLEHTTMSMRELEQLLLAAKAAGLRTLVRPTDINNPEITRILDAGADGIAFPHVENGELAERARKSLKYPPRGSRGWGGAHIRRTAWTGSTVASQGDQAFASDGVYTESYVEWAEDVVSLFLVESREGVENIDEILDRGRPDVVSFGMGDYSVEVRFDRDSCKAAAEKVHETCRGRGIGVAMPAQQSDRLTEFYPGCMYYVGVDVSIASEAISSEVHRSRFALSQSDQAELWQ
jgi:2-keto-3-deoxy-L-rhamnonate aldolase RhmA